MGLSLVEEYLDSEFTEAKNNVIQMPKKQIMKKDGSGFKKTPDNSKRNRDNIQPYKEEDIPRMIKYLNEFMKQSDNEEDYQIRLRNLTLFRCGINIALRVSDLVALQWSDIYNNKWEFLDGKKIKPQKTARTGKHVILKYNVAFRRAMTEYKDYIKPKDINTYIFSSRENSNGHITTDTVSTFLTKAADIIGLEYPTNTHSMRKAFARIRYDHSPDKEKTLVELQGLFRHTSTKITLAYICITEEEIGDLYNAINLGYDD